MIQCHVLWRLSATSLFLPEAFGGSGNRLGESTEMTEVGSVVITTWLSVWMVGFFQFIPAFWEQLDENHISKMRAVDIEKDR